MYPAPASRMRRYFFAARNCEILQFRSTLSIPA